MAKIDAVRIKTVLGDSIDIAMTGAQLDAKLRTAESLVRLPTTDEGRFVYVNPPHVVIAEDFEHGTDTPA
jgi:hypothetical protein